MMLNRKRMPKDGRSHRHRMLHRANPRNGPPPQLRESVARATIRNRCPRTPVCRMEAVFDLRRAPSLEDTEVRSLLSRNEKTRMHTVLQDEREGDDVKLKMSLLG